MMTAGTHLPGLDGSTPIGFLAGVGAAVIAADHHLGGADDPGAILLGWTDHHTPLLHGISVQDLADAVLDDQATFSPDPWTDQDPAHAPPKNAPISELLKVERATAPDPATMTTVPHPSSPSAWGALVSVLDPNPIKEKDEEKKTSRTVLLGSGTTLMSANSNANYLTTHITSIRKQGFEKTEGRGKKKQRLVTAAEVVDSLTGTGHRLAKVATFGIDPHPEAFSSAAVNGINSDSTGDPTRAWLALRALPLFPVFGRTTTGMTRRNGTTVFRWATWPDPINLAAVRWLVTTPPERRPDRPASVFVSERRARPGGDPSKVGWTLTATTVEPVNYRSAR